MGYCKAKDIDNRIGAAKHAQLTGGDSTITEAAIADADSVINFYGTVKDPALLRNLSVSLASFYLYQRAGLTPDGIKQGYEEAMKILTGGRKQVLTGVLFPLDDEKEEGQLIN